MPFVSVALTPWGIPKGLIFALKSINWKRLEKLYVDSCINCGCCTYICPARRHLAEHIVAGQKALKERQA